MGKVYYITFNWNKNFFYDGFILVKANGKIVGYTNDSIIFGDTERGIIEINGEQALYYEDTKGNIRNNIQICFKKELVITITDTRGRARCISSYLAMQRINNVLEGFPNDLKEAIKSYL